MNQPLVIAYHLVWTVYGSWLPNDPRGSGSRTIRSDPLAELGEIHLGRKRVQPPRGEVREFYAQAADLLKHSILDLDEAARVVVGEAFGAVIRRERYTCYACAVMPDHVHILIRKHRDAAEEIIENFILASRDALIAARRRDPDHPTWTAGPGWTVFLDHPDEVSRTIAYVERNPLPLRLPVQRWPFVVPYDDWPLHPGHSPNSPYAARLRAAGRYPN